MKSNDVIKARVKRSLVLTGIGVATLLGVQVMAVRADDQQPATPTSSTDSTAYAETSPAKNPGEAGMGEAVQPEKHELTGAEMAAAAWKAATPAEPPKPLVAALALSGTQIEQLDRLYTEFAAQRLAQEAKIAPWQTELKRAMAPTTLNERRANELLRSITQSQQTISAALIHSRTQAMQVLSLPQRGHLERLQSSGTVSNDKYSQLLLLPIETVLRTPIDVETGRRLLAESTNRRRPLGYDSYDVFGYGPRSLYGGYGYGSGFSIGIGNFGIGGFGLGGFGFGGRDGLWGGYYHHLGRGPRRGPGGHGRGPGGHGGNPHRGGRR